MKQIIVSLKHIFYAILQISVVKSGLETSNTLKFNGDGASKIRLRQFHVMLSGEMPS